jgi:hypothetical protein
VPNNVQCPVPCHQAKQITVTFYGDDDDDEEPTASRLYMMSSAEQLQSNGGIATGE